MKAIILAAGKGERLKEITQTIPKPMINFKGKPILEYNILLCKTFGITDIYINLHHLPEIIADYFGDGKKFAVNIHYSYEKELLGTAGAVKKIANDFGFQNQTFMQSSIHASSEYFFVIYGDNYSNFDLNLLLEKQKETKAICIIAFHYREDTLHSGIAEFDKKGRVLKFIEKPLPGESDSYWVNAGIYLLQLEILNYIPDGFSDFGKDIFPKILKENIS